MWFNSLLFAYTILRKQKDNHEIQINLPGSWFWWPITYRVVALDENYVVMYDKVDLIKDKKKLRFLVPDGWTLNVLLYYKGWFGRIRTKEINIPVPIRLKSVTDLSFEVLRLKNRYLI